MSGNIREEGLFIGGILSNPFNVNESTPFAAGQLGKISSFPNAGAENGVTAGPIAIQYVKRYATDTVAVIAGALAFWQDTDNFVVTSEHAVALGGSTEPLVAGVFAATTLAAGNYGFIQVGGVAPMLFQDSTSIITIGKNLVWSTTNRVKQQGTTNSDTPPVGVLRSLNTLTTTNLTAEVILSLPMLAGW